MRKCRNERNGKRFAREEWLTSVRIKNSFSRFAAARNKEGGFSNDATADDPVEDVENVEIENVERIDQIDVLHPIVYDIYNYVSIARKTNFVFLM